MNRSLNPRKRVRLRTEQAIVIRERIKHVFARLSGLGTSAPSHAGQAYLSSTRNDFCTHLPILIGVASIATVRSVLELGAGTYSTKLFLDRKIFPQLERIESIENNREWADRVRLELGEDPRLGLSEISGAVSQVLDRYRPNDFDLVFVDDSVTIEGRCETVRALAGWLSGNALAVVHDYEQPAYQIAGASIPYCVVFTAFHPSTALLWSDAVVSPDVLQEIEQRLRYYSRQFSPLDVDKWRTVLTVFRQ